MMKIERVTVVGCGAMGSGIAQAVAQAGYSVYAVDMITEQLAKAQANIGKGLDRMVAKGKFTREFADALLNRITFIDDIAKATDVDMAIEAVSENLPLKQTIFAQLDTLLPEHAVISSNTSSMLIREVSAEAARKDKILGTHFFNPVYAMKLVEVVCTDQTSDETYASVKAFLESIGKITVKAPDSTGFIVNTVLGAAADAGFALVKKGVTPQDVDTALKLGANYPMGPFELMDYCGLDITYYALQEKYEKSGYDEELRPPEVLKELVEAGHYGLKTKWGFYKYE